MHPTQKTSTSKGDIYQEVTNKLITLLENGTVPWKQLFKTSEHGFAQNINTMASTGSYSIL
jgi:antirestriction protein ArdC